MSIAPKVYSVELNPAAAVPRINGINAMLTQANHTAEATALVKATDEGQAAPLVWNGATVADIVTEADLEGWTFRVQVNTTIPVDVTYTGAADDTVDLAMTALAALLLTAVGTAISGTAHSAYNTSTNLLTVASAADGIGNKTITITVTPPTDLFHASYTWDQTDFVSSKVDGGMAGAVLTVQLSTTWLPPGVIQKYVQV